MNYKSNGKYFTQKNYLMYIGIGIAAVGIVFLLIGWWWMIAAGIIVVGLALVFVGREGLVKSEDVDNEVAKNTTAFEAKTIEKHMLDKESASVITFSEYLYDGQKAATMKKGSDGKFRPKTCTSTCLFTMGNSLVIDKEIFSIVEESVQDSSSVFGFDEILKLDITDKSIEDEGGVLVRYHALVVKGTDGAVLSEALIPQNSVLYDKIEGINREIKAARKKNN